MKIQVLGEKAAKLKLLKKKTKIKIDETIGLSKAALFLQGEVKQSIAGHRAEKTSVDTGRFLNSVDFQSNKDNAVVYSMVSYAKFLEFGTSKSTGRRHFNNSKDRNKKKIISIVRNNIKKI